MASLELRNGTYRVVFRYAGQKFARSLKTSRPSEANLALARLEDNLRRVELGTLVLESGADIPSLGERDHAIADYTEAIRIAPKFALALNNRGSLWEQKRELEKALDDCSEAIRVEAFELDNVQISHHFGIFDAIHPHAPAAGCVSRIDELTRIQNDGLLPG